MQYKTRELEFYSQKYKMRESGVGVIEETIAVQNEELDFYSQKYKMREPGVGVIEETIAVRNEGT